MCKGKDRKKGVRPNILFPKPPKKPCPSGNSICHCHPKLRETKTVVPRY